MIKAELWEIVWSLLLAKEKGIKPLLLESDSLLAVNAISSGCALAHVCHGLVRIVEDLMVNFDHVKINHVLREANQVADSLAKCRLTLEGPCRMFMSIPAFISNSPLGDAHFVTFPRGL